MMIEKAGRATTRARRLSPRMEMQIDFGASFMESF